MPGEKDGRSTFGNSLYQPSLYLRSNDRKSTPHIFKIRRSNYFYVAIVLVLFFLALYTSQKSSHCKIAIVTYESRPVSYWRESLGNKLRYARRHGYDIIPAIEKSQLHEGSVWDKILLIGNALDMQPRYEWILFMDFDTLFTNLSISIEDFLDDAERHHLRGNQRWTDVSMIASADCGPLNAGVLCFRNTDWTTWFLDSVWDMKGTPRTSEQDAMRTVLESLDEFNKPKHLVRVPQWKMNSYPDEISCHEDRTKKWAPGYWIIHFAVPPPEFGAWTYFHDHPDPFGALLARYYHRVVEQ